MPVQHRRKQRVPVDLEPELMAQVEGIVKEYSIPRSRLLRTLIKYGIKNLDNALRRGDSLEWQSTNLNNRIGDPEQAIHKFAQGLQDPNNPVKDTNVPSASTRTD